MSSPSQPPPALTARRLPRQRRSRAIVESILESAHRILEERGPDGLSTNRIAERAGISIGSLYRYFPNKEAIVSALCDADAERDAEAVPRSRWPIEGLPLDQAIARLVDFQLDRQRRFVQRFGDYYRADHRAHSLARKLGSAEVEQHIREILERHREELVVGDLDHAACILSRGVSWILHGVVEERPERLADPSFRSELIDMLTRYLLGASSASDPKG